MSPFHRSNESCSFLIFQKYCHLPGTGDSVHIFVFCSTDSIRSLEELEAELS